jgi:hypothetical protein
MQIIFHANGRILCRNVHGRCRRRPTNVWAPWWLGPAWQGRDVTVEDILVLFYIILEKKIPCLTIVEFSFLCF